jgi:hypothetical protein
MARMQGKDLTKVLKKFTESFERGPIQKETVTGGFEPVTETTRLNAIAKFKAATQAMESTCAQNVLGLKVRDTNSRTTRKRPVRKSAAKKTSAATKKSASRR